MLPLNVGLVFGHVKICKLNWHNFVCSIFWNCFAVTPEENIWLFSGYIFHYGHQLVTNVSVVWCLAGKIQWVFQSTDCLTFRRLNAHYTFHICITVRVSMNTFHFQPLTVRVHADCLALSRTVVEPPTLGFVDDCPTNWATGAPLSK